MSSSITCSAANVTWTLGQHRLLADFTACVAQWPLTKATTGFTFSPSGGTLCTGKIACLWSGTAKSAYDWTFTGVERKSSLSVPQTRHQGWSFVPELRAATVILNCTYSKPGAARIGVVWLLRWTAPSVQGTLQQVVNSRRHALPVGLNTLAA